MDRYKKYCNAKGILHILIFAYGLSMVFLFYKQTGWSGGAVYESDLPVHIRMIVEDGWYYSLTAFVYKAFYTVPVTLPGGALFGDAAVAVFLALCGVASVYLTAVLLRDMEKAPAAGEKGVPLELTAWHLLGGLILNLVMPCYVRGIADGRYIGMESASIWHNSTYIVMKMMGLLCVIYCGRLAKKYRDGITGREWLLFTGYLSICTAIKPSFLLVFAPAMAVFLLIDFLDGLGRKLSFKAVFGRAFVFGSVVFLPLFVVLFQNMALFGSDTGNGWEVRPGYALSLHSGYPHLSAIFSILFPLAILAAFLRELWDDRWFSGAWLMALIGFLEVFLFTETGSRAGDGNFMWGYSFAILMIFAAALVKWAQFGKQVLKKELRTEHFLRTGFFIGSGLILGWHLYCGVYFYMNLLRGVSYYMWD